MRGSMLRCLLPETENPNPASSRSASTYRQTAPDPAGDRVARLAILEVLPEKCAAMSALQECLRVD